MALSQLLTLVLLQLLPELGRVGAQKIADLIEAAHRGAVTPEQLLKELQVGVKRARALNLDAVAVDVLKGRRLRVALQEVRPRKRPCGARQVGDGEGGAKPERRTRVGGDQNDGGQCEGACAARDPSDGVRFGHTA
jgi:hypothetical protein